MPINTRKAFMAVAKPLKLDIELQPNEFSTGTVGWTWLGKFHVTLPNGEKLYVQGNLQLYAVGSKNWQDGTAPAKKADDAA